MHSQKLIGWLSKNFVLQGLVARTVNRVFKLWPFWPLSALRLLGLTQTRPASTRLDNNQNASELLDAINQASHQCFFRGEGIRLVCQVPEKTLQRSRAEFLQRHHQSLTEMTYFR